MEDKEKIAVVHASNKTMMTLVSLLVATQLATEAAGIDVGEFLGEDKENGEGT